MNIYIDESGSINNHTKNNEYFVIALIQVIERQKLLRAYKRFVASNFDELKKLDQAKTHSSMGKILKPSGRMFVNSKFKELKGSQFDQNMKLKFLEFFSKRPYFNIFYIRIDNTKLTDKFCSNTARVFNYSLKLALTHFLQVGLLPDEDCVLQLDERNERTNARYFLENYLNTELQLNNISSSSFSVTYYDSSNNKLIQIADVFANLFYSNLKTGHYTEEFTILKKRGMLRYIFDFPRTSSPPKNN